MIRVSTLIFTAFFLLSTLCAIQSAGAEESESIGRVIRGSIDFEATLRDWDGFGVNYVQLAQSADPVSDPQDYGGFGALAESQRQEILNNIFGEEGLKPSIIKMFLDPFHQGQPGEPFDHESTTTWMRFFAREGLRLTKEWGGDISIITTLYGPPAWATKQKVLRGRDLDSSRFEELGRYMVDWVRYLVDEEGLPVRYLSLHNEGDSPFRWPIDGSHGNLGKGHDYNVFWRPEQIAHFLEFMPSLLEDAGLDVGLTPGETSYWRTMTSNLTIWAILDNPEALKNLELITSHGFGIRSAIQSRANDVLRSFRPELHAWTTSATWGQEGRMTDLEFLTSFRRNIYEAKVNALIPWAIVKTSDWRGGDPNSSSAIYISDDGTIEYRPQYFYFKQLSRAGQSGMAVASVEVAENSAIELIAFAANGSENPDAFLIINQGDEALDTAIEIKGSNTTYRAVRSGGNDRYRDIGSFDLSEGVIHYLAPAGSVTTFFAK